MSGDGAVTPSTRKIDSFKASGRFLNWLSASKFDVEKKILTGGKYLDDADAGTTVLTGESRGCIGRRFVKQLPASHFLLPVPSGGTITPGLTFAVRGPGALEPGFINAATGGGPQGSRCMKRITRKRPVPLLPATGSAATLDRPRPIPAHASTSHPVVAATA